MPEQKTSAKLEARNPAFGPALGSPPRTHLDLFSGIGGFALAAQACGYQTIGFSEIDEYASKVLKRHWPNVPNYGDIRNIRGIRAHLVTGGFPCQPFSLAGKRGGKDDDRHLWPEMCRVIKEARPTWVLGENVPGLIGMELDSVLADMEALGYSCRTFVIPACAVDARHRRDRVWIVAHADQELRGQGSNGREHPSGQGPLHESARPDQSTKPVANSKRVRRREPTGDTVAAQGPLCATEREESAPRSGPSGEAVSHNGHGRGKGERAAIRRQSEPAWWLPEPDVGRVAHGIPNRTHRLRGLGNAIVPQVAETLIRLMTQVENTEVRRADQ